MRKVIIIGGGIAGMQCAITLKELGINPIVIEKDGTLAGKLNNWDRLFPTFTPAIHVLERLHSTYATHNIETLLESNVVKINVSDKSVTLEGGAVISGDAIVIASGFSLFDAGLKEEYGYGLYDNVITSVELENMFKNSKVALKNGQKPERIAILHCVGSRDEKVGQNHCSRLCCVTGVKQAIELKEALPDAKIFNFYMDMRMFGSGYEELYRSSQQDYGVNYIRGKISEASLDHNGKIHIKAEDTLVGRPLKMTVDMLVLMVGMCSGVSNQTFASNCGIKLNNSNFMTPIDTFTQSNKTECDGIFLAGTVKSPQNISETLNDAISAAHTVANSLGK